MDEEKEHKHCSAANEGCGTPGCTDPNCDYGKGLLRCQHCGKAISSSIRCDECAELSIPPHVTDEPQEVPDTDTLAGKVERIAYMMKKLLAYLPFCDPDIKDLEQAAAALRSLAVSRPKEN